MICDMCDDLQKNLDQPLSQYNGQIYFVRAIIVPLWELAAAMLPGVCDAQGGTLCEWIEMHISC